MLNTNYYVLLVILYDIILETKRNKYVCRSENMSIKISNGFQILQDLIKLRWVPEILKSIELGNHQYSQILKSIPYMSHTELNRKLALLVEKNVVEKTIENNTIYYSLLNFGKDLVHIFNHLEDLEDKYFQIS